MNNDMLTELPALEAKATPAPWEVEPPTMAGSERPIVGAYGIGGVCALSMRGAPKYQASLPADDPLYRPSALAVMEANAALIVAMRNALPELLHYAKIGSEPCDDCAAFEREWRNAVDFADAAVAFLRRVFPDVEPDPDDMYHIQDFEEAAREYEKALAAALARAEKAEADKSMLFDEALRQKKRAIKAEAERDVLVEVLAWGAGKEKRSIFDKLSWMDGKKKWLEYAAQEAAKREGGGE